MLKLKRLFILSFTTVVLGPVSAHAQEASLLGTVVDETAAVLPGVTVTATSVETGRQFSAPTKGRGEYRIIGVPAGRYKIQATMTGFTTVVIPEIELLVGQNRTIPFTLKLATSEEVTVTGEAPLVDTKSSAVAGNIDRRAMEQLPLQGRNWMELAMMVKGITANEVTDRPGVRDRQFQLNLDGQEITQQVAGSGFGQPRFSREAIAEFQVVTNMFDITMGRSQGIQVQAISRSGTNKTTGSVYGFFRDDKFNAKDFISNTVLPYSNQQVGAAIGGPIIKDKMHYFLSYEYEREPGTIIAAPPTLAGQSFAFPTKLTQNSFLGRADHQLSAKDHLTLRGSYWDWKNPFTQVSGTEHPSQAADRSRIALNVVGTWARAINSDMFQDLKLGYSHFNWRNGLAIPGLANFPTLAFPGQPIGQRRNYPQEFFQDTISLRYNLAWRKGAHEMKMGAEYLRWHDTGQWQLLSRGEFVFTSVPADLSRRIPASAWNDPTKWDLSGLEGSIQRYDQNFGDWTIDIPRPTWGIWFGDTWAVNNRLTVNYGVRWDADWGATAPPFVTTQTTFAPRGGVPFNDVAINSGDLLFKNDIRDLKNIAPRGGFTWNVKGDGSLVIRGGSGLYYSIPDSNTTFSQQSFNGQRILVNSFANDRLPGFIQDPTRGKTGQDFISGKFPLPPQQPRVIAHDYQMPYTWQTTLGFQKQLGEVMMVEADYTQSKAYNQARSRDLNLFFNPVTGYNLNPNAATGRPDPNYTSIAWLESSGKADSSAISAALHRRYRNNFQASMTYTYTIQQRDNTTGFQYQPNNVFDMDADWARSTEFQRHTLRLNALYNLPKGFSVAGAYLYGSGNYYATSISTSPYGAGASQNRLLLPTAAAITIPESVAISPTITDRVDVSSRFDGPSVITPGSVVPRNALAGLPLHKVDLRVTKDVKLPGNTKLTAIGEAFNVFNHANYGAYNSVINTTTFGQPRQNAANTYLPRVLQLAVKFSF